MKGRKVVVEETLSANGVVTATGQVIAVRMRDDVSPPAAGDAERGAGSS
jgi:hypothetical protein